jgi:hypothetical protein
MDWKSDIGERAVSQQGRAETEESSIPSKFAEVSL